MDNPPCRHEVIRKTPQPTLEPYSIASECTRKKGLCRCTDTNTRGNSNAEGVCRSPVETVAKTARSRPPQGVRPQRTLLAHKAATVSERRCTNAVAPNAQSAHNPRIVALDHYNQSASKQGSPRTTAEFAKVWTAVRQWTHGSHSGPPHEHCLHRNGLTARAQGLQTHRSADTKAIFTDPKGDTMA